MQDGAVVQKQGRKTSQQDKTTSSAKPMYLNLTAAFALFVFALVLYLPSMRNDFIYDDHQLIIEQPMPRSAGDILKVFGERHWYNLPYYRPVARVTMVAQKFLHGDQPGHFHLFNAVLMGLAAALAYGLLRLPVFNIRPIPALLSAAIFSAHPIASSCVYPICSGRETLMPAVFTIAALYCFLRKGLRWYVLAMLSFALALFSKEQAVIILPLFVLADLLGLSAGRPGRSLGRWLKRYLPVTIILAAYLVIRLLVLGGKGQYHPTILARPYGPLLSLLYAMQTIFAPFFELVYEPRAQVWLSTWRIICGIVIIIFLAVCARSQWSRVRKLTLFWLGWIVLSIGPTANILLQETSFAERYGFLALLGTTAVVATIVSADGDKAVLRRLTAAAGVVIVIACGIITFNRAGYFRDDLTFLNQWLKTDPYSPQAHASLGQVFYRHQEYDKAVSHYRKALQFGRDCPDIRAGLGIALAREGGLEEAMMHFEKALELKPDNAKAHNDIATVLQLQSKTEQAISHYKEALKLNPYYAEAHYNLAVLFQAQGKVNEATEHYRSATKINPYYTEAHNNLGIILQLQGKLDEAIGQYRKVLKLNPDYAKAHYNLGMALEAQSKLNEAVKHYQKALQIQPDYARAQAGLACALQLQGKFDEAAEHYQRAVLLKPDDAVTHNKLALALTMAGKTGRAVEHFRQAARLKPDWPAPLNSLAWVLATSKNLENPDPNEAIALAGRSAELTGHEDASVLDTLAAAYASAGRFDKAIETAEKAIELAEAAGAEKTAAQIKNRLALYEEGRAYREDPPK